MFSFLKRKTIVVIFIFTCFISLLFYLSSPVKTESEIIGNSLISHQEYLTTTEKQKKTEMQTTFEKSQMKLQGNIEKQKSNEKEYKKEFEKFELEMYEKNKVRFSGYLTQLQKIFADQREYRDDDELYTSYIQVASHIEDNRFLSASELLLKIEWKIGVNILDK